MKHATQPQHMGQQVAAARTAQGIGPYSLARRVGTSAQTILNLEESGWVRQPDLLQKIANELAAFCRSRLCPATPVGDNDRDRPAGLWLGFVS